MIVKYRIMGDVGDSYDPNDFNKVMRSVEINLLLLKTALARSVSLKKQENWVAKISVNPISTKYIKDILESVYGAEISQAGFYEDMGLDNEKIDINNRKFIEGIRKYFDKDLGQLLFIHNSFTPITENPYMVVLAMPLEARPFFTGAINNFEKKTVPPLSFGSSEDFTKALSLSDIFEYAKVVGEIPKTKEYYDFYLSL